MTAEMERDLQLGGPLERRARARESEELGLQMWNDVKFKY